MAAFSAISAWVKMVKSLGMSGSNAVTLAKYRADLLPGLVYDILTPGRELGGVEPPLMVDAPHVGGIGNVELIVLIPTVVASALGHRNAKNGEGLIADAQGGTDGVEVAKEEVGGTRTKHTDPRSRLDFVFGEVSSNRHRHLAHGRVVRVTADDTSVPVEVAVHALCIGISMGLASITSGQSSRTACTSAGIRWNRYGNTPTDTTGER